MSEGKPTPVRLTDETLQRLDLAAKKMGLGNRTSLIKMSITSFLEYFEQTGMAGLPLNWKEIIHKLDGRSQRYKNFNIIANSVVNGDIVNHNGLKVAEKPAHYGTEKKGGKK